VALPHLLICAKLMIDGAFSRTGNRGAVGIVCRNCEGLYMGWPCVFPGVTDPAVLACREALSLAADLNERKISISSDCKNILHDIAENLGGTSAAIVREINEFCWELCICSVHS
jgi:ribonuclease HI